MNDYYMMMCDLEQETKEHEDDIFDSWLDYECDHVETPTIAMYKKTVNSHEIEITESQYKGQLNLSIRNQQSNRLVFNLDLDLDDETCGDDSCYGTLVKLAQDWINPVEHDEF